MNIKERKNLEKKLIKENRSKPVAKIHTWRYYLISKTPIVKILEKLDKKWGEPIKDSFDDVYLTKKLIYGKLMTLGSYPIIFGSVVASFITKTPFYLLGGGSLGAYLNWRGEIEWLNAEERIKELNIDTDKALEKWLKK